ncbi:MAG: hypothetical protein ABI743_06410 [bacterium]
MDDQTFRQAVRSPLNRWSLVLLTLLAALLWTTGHPNRSGLVGPPLPERATRSILEAAVSAARI